MIGEVDGGGGVSGRFRVGAEARRAAGQIPPQIPPEREPPATWGYVAALPSAGEDLPRRRPAARMHVWRCRTDPTFPSFLAISY